MKTVKNPESKIAVIDDAGVYINTEYLVLVRMMKNLKLSFEDAARLRSANAAIGYDKKSLTLVTLAAEMRRCNINMAVVGRSGAGMSFASSVRRLDSTVLDRLLADEKMW